MSLQEYFSPRPLSKNAKSSVFLAADIRVGFDFHQHVGVESLMWTTMRELSERQVDALKDEMRNMLRWGGHSRMRISRPAVSMSCRAQ